MKRSAFVLAAALALAPMLPAQNEPTAAQMAQMMVQRYTQTLSLTPTQQEQALVLFTTEQTAEATIHTSERLARQMLATAIEANDTASMTQVSALVGELNGQTTLAHSVAEAGLYLTLTADQKTKFAQLLANDQGGGPGGPPRR